MPIGACRYRWRWFQTLCHSYKTLTNHILHDSFTVIKLCVAPAWGSGVDLQGSSFCRCYSWVQLDVWLSYLLFVYWTVYYILCKSYYAIVNVHATYRVLTLKLVLNRFGWIGLPEAVSRNRSRSHCSFGTGLGCMWSRIHQLSTETMALFLVVWAKMTLLHAKNRHFVLSSIQAASAVVELFWTFVGLSRYSQTSFNSHHEVSWV